MAEDQFRCRFKFGWLRPEIASTRTTENRLRWEGHAARAKFPATRLHSCMGRGAWGVGRGAYFNRDATLARLNQEW